MNSGYVDIQATRTILPHGAAYRFSLGLSTFWSYCSQASINIARGTNQLSKMPRFKQPAPLQKRAFESLVNHILYYCDRLCVAGDLNHLRGTIAVIKEYLHSRLPSIFFVEVCREFLDAFRRTGRKRLFDQERNDEAESETNNEILIFIARLLRKKKPEIIQFERAALEMIMDIEITGLRCGGEILRSLDPDETHRLMGLEILDLSKLENNRPKLLDNFRLQNLTTFIFPRLSTDDDLEILGSHCPKLQVLMIEESKLVTDRGLRALRSCTELRVIILHYCGTSDAGINEMLSANEKLEEFNVGHFFTFGENSFEILSREKSLVCPSIKRFIIKSNPVTDEHLNAVVTLFPNLTYLRICCKVTGDIRVLKKLDKLTELYLSYGYSSVSMHRLKELLIDIGANISLLSIRYCNPAICVTQNDLNFLYKYCINLETLEFDWKLSKKFEKLFIPPFRKLKDLCCIAMTQFTDFHAALDFGKMLELEKLHIQGFDDIFQITESIMLDHTKFPNLKVLQTFYNESEPVRRINEIVKNNNLDFTFQFSQ